MKLNIRPFSGSEFYFPGLHGIIFQQKTKPLSRKDKKKQEEPKPDWHIHVYKGREEISWARIQCTNNEGLHVQMHFAEQSMHEYRLKFSFLSFIERWAKAKGFKFLQIFSRSCGAGFYERLQYKAVGKESVINGFRHLLMKKTL